MDKADSVVIIPTYNEKENIENIIRAVFSLAKVFHILVIEDSSPDGTADIVRRLQGEFADRLFMIERKGKLGLGVAVVDDKIVGLITDGDIRRAMEKWQAQFFDRTVADIMTRQPKVVPPEMKISEIQGIMNKYKIHTVLVVDNENHLLGVVDHYRCML